VDSAVETYRELVPLDGHVPVAAMKQKRARKVTSSKLNDLLQLKPDPDEMCVQGKT
jgi:hypothetical protein